MKDEIKRLADQYQFFHWHLAFPKVFRLPTKGEIPENEQTGWSGGFDVVLGNPPWERIKIQEKEWFAARKPSIANAANAAHRKRLIDRLQYDDPELYKTFYEDQRKATGESHIVRDSGRYPLCGRGDVNTYTIFAENMHHVISPTGRLGCVVPSGIATDNTTQFFFRDLVDTMSLVSLFSFINEAKLFPGIDHRVGFALLTISGNNRKVTEADFAFGIYRTDDLQQEDRHFSLSARDIELLNPNTRTCPIFRSKRDKEITTAIYEHVPVLIKEGPPEENPWNVKFHRMFDMANDSHLFRSREQLEKDEWILAGNIFEKNKERYLPLYEGKMIWQLDHRFGTYEGQTQAQANQGKLPELGDQHKDPYLYSLPQYWIHESHYPTSIARDSNAFNVFRDITNATVLRTAIFSIVPFASCGHTLPIITLNTKASVDLLLFNSCCCSFVFDYVGRQKLGGTHMTFFILEQLPVLLPQLYKYACGWNKTQTAEDWITPRMLELTYTAWDLEAFAKDCGYSGPPFQWDEERRFLLRCELDAAYFHLYGIQRDDVDYIMETFPIVKRKDEKQYGDYRTKQVILEIYDEMQRAIESGEPYQTRLDPPPADPAVAHPPRTGVEV
nr:hypothetical protein [Dictyobacter kobayashii]